VEWTASVGPLPNETLGSNLRAERELGWSRRMGPQYHLVLAIILPFVFVRVGVTLHVALISTEIKINNKKMKNEK
jgi:hypothetical protein